MIVVHHHRMPKWFEEIDWSYTDGGLRREVTTVKMPDLPLIDQMRTVARSRGFITITGSSLTNQIYLPPYSAILQVAVSWLEAVESKECSSQPRHCHDIMGISMGHSFMNWRSRAFGGVVVHREPHFAP